MQIMQAIGNALGALGPVLGQIGGQQGGAPVQGQGLGFGMDGAAITPQGNAATLGLPGAQPQNPGQGAAPGAGDIGGLMEAIKQIIAGFMRAFGFNAGGGAQNPGNPVVNPGFDNPENQVGNPVFDNPGGGGGGGMACNCPCCTPGNNAPIMQDPGQGNPARQAVAQAPAAGAAQAGVGAAEYEKGLFDAVNQTRTGMGLGELKWADDLAGTARQSAAAATHLGAPEILAFGDNTPDDAIGLWRNSPGHWNILTSPNMTEMGTGRSNGNSGITFR